MSNTTTRRITGDTFPIKAICYYYGDPYDWTGATATNVLEELVGTGVTEAGTVTAHPTQTVTLDSTNNWVHKNAHGIKKGNTVVFATSGSLSGTNLAVSTHYKVVEADENWFRVSLSSTGAAITIAAAGSGTVTVYVVGSIEYTPAAAEVTSSKSGWFVSTEGSTIISFPDTKPGYTLDIQAQGN